MKSTKYYLSALLLIGISFSGKSCTTKEESPIIPMVEYNFTTQTEKLVIKVDTLHTGLQNPWGMTWLTDGRMLVTERKGEILIFKDDKST